MGFSQNSKACSVPDRRHSMNATPRTSFDVRRPPYPPLSQMIPHIALPPSLPGSLVWGTPGVLRSGFAVRHLFSTITACTTIEFHTHRRLDLLPPRARRARRFQTKTDSKIMICSAASTGAPSRPAYRHRGIGYDYAFADVVGQNVVRVKRGPVRARQASCSSLEYK